MNKGFDSVDSLEAAARAIAQKRVPDEPWFRWMNLRLERQPVALGGEPCCHCGEPIAPTAARRHRERHVCGSRCNQLVVRKLHRAVKSGKEPEHDVASLEWPDVIDELQREPRLFSTDWTADFPFAHGRWAKPGDIIERFGHHTVYFQVSGPNDLDPSLAQVADQIDPTWERIVGLSHRESGAQSFMKTDAAGRPTRLRFPVAWPLGDSQGVFLHQEKFLSVDRFGIPFQWWVPVFTPFPFERLYSTQRIEYNAQRKRINQARSSYQARLRTLGIMEADAEFVDPFEIYNRDGWICGVCRKPINEELSWPNPMAASLDHVVPVSDGGTHDLQNLQATHLVCNLSKGNSGF